jgi:outer membrane protein assembly factor BamB
MKPRFLPFAVVLLLPVAAARAAAPAADTRPDSNWPMFRGPNAAGTASGARPPTTFGPAENLLWSTAVPSAPSSPCVWGDRVFLTTFAEGRLETWAIDATSGRKEWSAVAPAEALEEYHGSEGSPAASTPATDGRRVVSYFGSSGLIAYDFAGKELWRRPLPVARTAGNFGSGTSPLIAGGRVILNRDLLTGSTLLAFELETGKPAWEAPRPEAPTSYSTPVLWQREGATEVVIAGSLTMKAYDPATGSERWRVLGLPSYTCSTPVLGDGLLFFAGWAPGKADAPMPTWASMAEKQDKNGDGFIAIEEFADGPVWFKAQDIDGDGRLEKEDWDAILGLMKRGENVALAVRPGGSGDVTATHVAWKYTRGLPYVPCPLYYDGRVYLIRDGGMLTCLDAKTGEAIYAQERVRDAAGGYYASPVAADGRIFVASLAGKVTVLRAGGKAPEILHQTDFAERISATPALAGNRLYLRTPTRLMAFGSAEVAAR